MPDPSNAKEYLNSYLKRKNTKSVKRSSYSESKSYRKPKNYLHKISYYNASENVT